MITITPQNMTAEQQREIVPWLEAHGVVAAHVFRLDVEEAAGRMTVHEYEFGPDGQMRVVGDELVKRTPRVVDVGLALLPWMKADHELFADPVLTNITLSYLQDDSRSYLQDEASKEKRNGDEYA